MATFQEVYTRVLRIVNWPASEVDVLAEAKAAVNDAIRHLQRDHAFAYTEALAKFEYPAGALYVDLSEVCDSRIRDYMTLQKLASNGNFEGIPIKLKHYSQIQADRRGVYRRGAVDPDEAFSQVNPGLTIEDRYRNEANGWIMSKYLGIYPVPQQAANYILHFHAWLPELVGDDDSNFFIDHTQDLVVMLAVRQMQLVLKSDSRFAVTDAQIQRLIDAAYAWDSQVREFPNMSIQ